MNKLKCFLTALLLGIAVSGFAQADGEYYLYEVANKQFLSHGENWGTRAVVDFYGSPVTWNSAEGSLKFKDNDLCLFLTGDGFFYTDNASSGFKFTETEGGYYLQTKDGANYVKLVDGALLKCLMPTTNSAEAVVWQLKTKAERDAIVEGYVNQNYVNVINAAGLDVTASGFLAELAKYTPVDKTSAIGTAKFAGSVGSWTYTQVRDQGGQPAYGTDFCELWQETGYHTQTISGLTPGIYKITFNGFERAAGWQKCNDLAAQGYEISTTTFTANGQHVALKSWYSDKSGDNDPDNTGQAVAKFNESKYLNEVYAYVGEDGNLSLILDKHAHVGGNWVLFNNFTLTYYEAPAVPAYTEVANIADVKKLANGTEFKLTLTDAKVTVQTFSMRGMMILLEDATGAIDVSEMSALEGFVEQNIINGTLYGVYRNEFGTIGLGLSENTEKSEITAQPGVVTPTKFTIADVKNEANYYKFVELNDCKAVYDEENYTWWAFVGTDSIAITDRFNKAVNLETGEPEIPANIKSMTGIVMFDGEKWVICPYAYGENKAIVADVVEDGPVVTTYDFEDGNILFTCDSRISAEVVSGEQTVKGTNENTFTLDSKAVRFKCANNAQNGYSFAHYDFSSLVEKAKSVKVDFEYWNTDGGRAIVSLGDASVRGTTGNSSKTTYSNKGAIFALGSNKDNALLNGAKSSKGTYCDKWLNVSVTVDVLNATYSYSIKEKATGTEIKAESDIAYYSKEALACSQIDLFGFINNSTPALFDNIVITVEKDNRVYADYKVTYVDESGAEIKDATVRNGAANEAAEVVNSDKESFKNADGTKKYIYKSDDSEGKTIAEDGSTVITVTFREAVKYNYSVEAVNEAGELMRSLGEYSDFEGENAKAPYNTYVLNESDSTLYEAAKTGMEYNKYVALTEDNMKVQVTYTKSSISNVVYYQEAENVWGLTKATNGNTGIRSSNSASAYAAEEDVELTSLSTGKYKMTAVICDAKTDKSGSFSFIAKADTILTVNTVNVNWTSGTSEEFTVIGNTPISLVKGGNDMQAVDFFYIQKTGVVPPTEVANIAALKDVQEGMEVKLALTNAVVNLWSGTGQSMASYVEDATGAIKFDMGLSNIEWMRDSIAMNGYVYASYGKDYDGIPQLSVSDSTIASKVDTVAAVPTSKVMTVADASTESAISRYVKFEKVEFAKKVIDDWGTTECYLVQGTDTITFFDKFSLFGWGAMPDFKSFDEVQGFISVYEGQFEFYPYGEYKATYTPAVVVENIAAAKAVESGTNVNLTLKDAKITAYLPSKYGGSATAFIEDASGAIQISGDVLSAVGVESNNMILNGNMYVKYVNEWGTIQLSSGDSLAYSKVEAKEGVVEATTMAVKDIKAETNVARYIEIASPSFKYDEENYCYVAIQEGDTIIVVDNFGWMSQNFEMDDEYNLILPDSVTSIKGIVMWDDWNGYSISPLSIEEYVAPQDIVVNVAEGEISAAVEAEKAKVAKVGNITINLTAGAAYTIANTIEAPAGIIINGNGATIDASALAANFIQSAVTEEAKTVDSIAVLNVTVKGLGKALYYSAGKNIGISNFVVDNSVIEMAKDVVVFDFTKGSAALNFAVKNSTIYAQTATTKSIYSSQGGEKGDAYGATVDTPQTFSFENTTLYNIAYNKNFFTHRSNGQKWMKFVVKNNVIVNSGKANFMTSVNGGQDSPNPIYDADAANSVGTLVDGAYTDLSASQTVQGNAMGTSVVTNPGFKDVSAGDFTVYAGSEQAKQKIGDPRWLVEFDETLTGIDGINAAETLNGAVYTINGIKVREAGETLKGLSKGMYIINGKKYVVK